VETWKGEGKTLVTRIYKMKNGDYIDWGTYESGNTPIKRKLVRHTGIFKSLCILLLILVPCIWIDFN
jgi:hypothetical protein